MNSKTDNSLNTQLSDFISASAYSDKRKTLLQSLMGATGKLVFVLEHLEKSYTSAIPEFRSGMTLDCELSSNPKVKVRLLTHKRENKRVSAGRSQDTVKATVKIIKWLNSYDRFLAVVVDQSIAIEPRLALNKTNAAAVEPPQVSEETHSAVTDGEALQVPDPEPLQEQHLPVDDSIELPDSTPETSEIAEEDSTSDEANTTSAEIAESTTTDDNVVSCDDFNAQVAEDADTDLAKISDATELIWKLLLNPLSVGSGEKSLNVPGVGEISIRKDGAIAELSIDRSNEPKSWEVREYAHVLELAPRKRNALEKRALKLSLDLNETLGIARGDAFSIAAATLRLANDLLASDIGIELPDKKALQRKVVGDTSKFVIEGAQSLFQGVANSIVNILDTPSANDESTE